MLAALCDLLDSRGESLYLFTTMSHFDDLPSRHRSHVTEDEALSAFQSRLLECNAFILQSADRKDYGVDCQIEVLNQGSVSNVRIYVQLKGTERSLNSDGSVSIEIARTNFNYLLAQPYRHKNCTAALAGS